MFFINSKELDHFTALSAPGSNPAVLVAVGLPSEVERHCHVGQLILFRGGRNAKYKIFGLGSHWTARGDVTVAGVLRAAGYSSAYSTSCTGGNRSTL
jgi:hypothetical protein